MFSRFRVAAKFAPKNGGQKHSLMKKLKKILVRLLSSNWLFRYVARKAGYVKYDQHVPPGHFYSPIADPKEVEQFAAQVFTPDRRTLPAIDLREKEQLAPAAPAP